LTQKEKSAQKRANQEAAGIPDSKLFAQQVEENAHDRIARCHINGVLIAELHLDPQVLAALDYYATDEGIAENAARPNVRVGPAITVDAPRQDRRWIAESSQGPGHFEDVTRSTDAFGKALDQRRDDVLERGIPSYLARDPFKETADKYAVPGMKSKFLSRSKIKDAGTGDYVIVKDPKTGEPVSSKGMILGHVPEKLAEARNAHYRNRGNQMIDQIKKQYKETGGATAVVDK
jgi:hypothetical protein